MGCSASVFGKTVCPPIKPAALTSPSMRCNETCAKAKSTKLHKKSTEKVRTTTMAGPGLTQVSDVKTHRGAGKQCQTKSNRLKSPVQPTKNKKFRPVPPELAVEQKSADTCEKVCKTEASKQSSENPVKEHVGAQALAAMESSGGVTPFTGKQTMDVNANVQVSSTDRSAELSQRSTVKKDDSQISPLESSTAVNEDVEVEINDTRLFGVSNKLPKEIAATTLPSCVEVLADGLEEGNYHESDRSILPAHENPDRETDKDDEELLEITSFKAATSALLTAVDSLIQAQHVISHEYNRVETCASNQPITDASRLTNQVEDDVTLDALEMTSGVVVTSAISTAVEWLIDSQGADGATKLSTMACLETMTKQCAKQEAEDVEANEPNGEVTESESREEGAGLVAGECGADKDDSAEDQRHVSPESTEEQDSETQLSAAITDILRSDTVLHKTRETNETSKTKKTGSSSRNSIEDMASGSCSQAEMVTAQSLDN